MRELAFLCACDRRLPGKWMCWPHQSPAGGEASEAAPWQWPGQGGVCICAALARKRIGFVVGGVDGWMGGECFGGAVC